MPTNVVLFTYYTLEEVDLTYAAVTFLIPLKILPFFSLVSVGDGSRSSFSLPLPVAGIPPHNLSFMLVLLCSSLHWVFIQSQLQDSCTHPFALTIGGSRSLSSMHTLT